MEIFYDALPATRDKTLVMRSNGEELVFIVSALTQQVRKTVGRNEHMDILVSYIVESGIEKEIFDVYKRIHKQVEKDLVSKPSKKYFDLLNELCTYFKFNDVLAHVNWYDVNVQQIHTAAVKETFDNEMAVNGQGTRAKTYTTSDYMDLLALAVVSKAFYGPIIYAITLNVQATTKHQEPLVAYTWLKATHIGTWAPFQKCYEFAKENIMVPFKQQIATYAYGKLIGTDAIIDRMVGMYLFKLFPYSIVTNHEKNLVSSMFGMTRNEFGHLPKLIEKEAGASDTGKESVFEMHRIASSITQGNKAMFHAYAELPHLMFENLCTVYGHSVSKGDLDRLTELTEQLSPLDNNVYNAGVIKLIEFGMHKVMHPEVINYLNRGHLKNICAVLTLFTWLYSNKTIALLFTTLLFRDKHNRMQSGYRSKLDTEVSAEIEGHFEVMKTSKVKGVVEESSPLQDIINEIIDGLTDGSYAYIQVGYTEDKILALDKNIKNDLSKFISDMLKRK